MALITMSTSSYLINYNREIYEQIEPYLERFNSEDKEDIELRKFKDHAVIVGYNNTIERILPVLKQEYGDIIIVWRNSDNTERLSRKDVEYIYGDFKHGEIRKSCNLKNAGFVLSISPDLNVQHQIIEEDTSEGFRTIFGSREL